MITHPLDLESKLSAVPRDLDMMFWVNVGVVMLFFSLLGSRFVLAPGLPVQLGNLILPVSKSTTQSAASVVISYRRDNMVIFEGGIFDLQDLRPRIQQYGKDHPGSVMLVRYDKAVSMQGFVDLCDLARAAGLSVLVAAEPQVAEESGLIKPLR